MKFKISATIPVVQYGNIAPEIEVEADTFEEGYNKVMPHIRSMWNTYVEAGKKLPETTNLKTIEAFVGGKIGYDDSAHVYMNEAGEQYMSGSQYAKQFEKPFDMTLISGKMASKAGVKQEDILSVWKLKAETSANFGTSVHQALQLYADFKELSEKLGKTYHLHDCPTIKKIVEAFYEGRDKEKSVQEALVVDHAKKRAGRIDRLLITGDKKCRVQDFKTNADITDKMPMYWEQLNFYASIMTANGWEVEGLDIFHLEDASWKTYSNKVKEI